MRIDSVYVPVEKAKALSDQDWEILRSISDAPDNREQLKYGVSTRDLIYLEEDGPKFSHLGLGFTIKKFPGQLKLVLPGVPDMPDSKQVVHVHVPNIGLLQVDEVTNLDDCCTDVLQAHLDKGWRILCVCPPNNQRRPDYIMGRSSTDRKGDAK